MRAVVSEARVGVRGAQRPVLLVVPDGAADPLADGRTCLETARTPALDELVATGELRRVRTIPPGLAPGTEVGLPGLLGARLDRAPSRGRIEAAAAGVSLRAGEGAWRLDLVPQDTSREPPTEVDAELALRLDAAMRGRGARVHRLRGHRLLLVGPAGWGDAPRGPHQGGRWPGVTEGPFGAVARAGAAVTGPGARPWPWGALGSAGDLQGVDGHACTVITPGGAAAGIAAASGCTVIRAAGPAAWSAAAAALRDSRVVVVHDDQPDEAGHARDRAAKVAAIERLDAAVGRHLALLEHVQLVLCPDHGCDPATGQHTAEPVPALVRPGRALANKARFTERGAAGIAEQPAHTLLRGLLRGERAQEASVA